jgi:hypothetical protein
MRATLEEYKKVTVKTNKHLSDLDQKKTSTPDITNNTSLTYRLTEDGSVSTSLHAFNSKHPT